MKNPFPAIKNCFTGKVCMLTTTALIAVIVSLIVVLIYNCCYLPKKIAKHIINNPHDIITSIQKLEDKRREELKQKTEGAAAEFFDKVKDDGSIPYIGNEKGENKIVEFFDYTCHYCKKLYEQLDVVLKERPDVKIILIDLPILSPNSALTAKAGLYVYDKHPKKFTVFHRTLLTTKDSSKLNEAGIMAIMQKLQIAPKNFKSEVMDNEVYNIAIKSHYYRANEMGIDGTPVLIVNGKMVVGAKDAKDIIAMLQ